MNRPFAMLSMISLALATLVASADASSPRRHPPGHHGRHDNLLSVNVPIPREVRSDLCGSNERAEKNVREKLGAEVKTWLGESGVSTSWKAPQKLIDRMMIGQAIYEPVKVEDLDLIRATVTADFSEARKREFVDLYKRQQGSHRLTIFGGGLAVILAALAGISGYIRADDATMGYYTKRLRILTAVGVGAAGIVVYKFLT